jgi:hypothetical protein
MSKTQRPRQPAIKIFLSEKEISSANSDRLIALFANQDAAGLRALHQSVVLVLPRNFSSRFTKLSFEHPEVRAFAAALTSNLPGFSFFLNLDSPKVFKQLLFATLPTIRIARHGRKALVSLPGDEFVRAMEREIDAAANLARKAGFSLIPTEKLALTLKNYFDSPEYR